MNAVITFNDDPKKGLQVSIDTQQLRLSPLTVNEEKAYRQLFTDPAIVSKNSGHGKPHTHEEIEARLRRSRTAWERHSPFGTFAIFEKKSNTFVGTIDLRPFEEEVETIVMGYLAIALPYQRKGYATETVRALINDYIPLIKSKGYLIDRLDGSKPAPLTRLYRVMRTDNPAAQWFESLAKKLGFTPYGIREMSGKQWYVYTKTLEK